MSNKKFFLLLGSALLALIIIAGVSFSLKQGLFKIPFNWGTETPNVPQENPNNQNHQEEEPSKINKTLEEKIATQGQIKEFENLEEIKSFLLENPLTTSNYVSGRRSMELSAPQASDMATKEESYSIDAGAETPDYSDTNIQEVGVGEADIIKTDGNYVYAVANSDLFIIKSFPAEETELITKIKFDSQPQNIYLKGDKLIIFGHDQNFYQQEKFETMVRRGIFTYLKIFDISDKSNPEQVRDLKIEGNYFDSRLVGDHVYFITSNYRYNFREGDPILPRIIENDLLISDNCRGARCLEPNVYYFDIPYDQYNFTNITSININDDQEKINNEVYLFSGSQNIYVSLENLYITYTKMINPELVMIEATMDIIESIVPESDKVKIEDIRNTKDHVLTDEEKMEKIAELAEKHFYNLSEEEQEDVEQRMEQRIKEVWLEVRGKIEKTVIHKIAINNGELDYKTEGEVTGHVLNQFSMSEQDDYFRIATTKNRDWGLGLIEGEEAESYSNIYVLDNDLNLVGKVEGLAPTERIYSARFMQDRAYLVTFRQIDPLFVIDLKNPLNPKVLGELKITGFSNYLHPFNENILIGIGKEANERGIEEGLKISLFDVSDVTNPKEAATYVLGDRGSNSLALNNHKAFLFSKDKSLLAIPVEIRGNLDELELFMEQENLNSETAESETGEIQEESSSENKVMEEGIMDDPDFAMPSQPIRPDIAYIQTNYFRGAAVFYIDENSLELKGLISHGDSDSTYDNQIKRIIYIEDNLYTLSNSYIKINQLENLETIKHLKLELEGETDYQIIN